MSGFETVRTPPLPSQKRRLAELHAHREDGRDYYYSRRSSVPTTILPFSSGETRSNHYLPLAPPTPEEEEHAVDDGLREVASSISSRTTVRPITPQQNPVTPDLTPPERSLPLAGNSDSFSSRSDSFRTAVENQSSADDDGPWYSAVSLVNPHTLLSQQKSFRSNKSAASKSVQTSRSVSRAPTTATDHMPEQSVAAQSEEKQSERPQPQSEERQSKERYGEEKPQNYENDPDGILVLLQKRCRRPSSLLPSPTIDGSANAARQSRVPATEKPLRDRVKDANWAVDSPSVEQFRQKIDWPTNVSTAHRQPEHSSSSSSRHSTDSPTSNTVTAMIIDPYPQRTLRHLRHAPKQSCLRSISSPIPRSLLASEPVSRELNLNGPHQNGRPVQSHRHRHRRNGPRSISSDLSAASTRVSSTPTVRDVIPVVVIPERYSSREFSSPSSVHAGSTRTGSTRAASQASDSRRDKTGHSETGLLDNPRRRKRRLSSSNSSTMADSTIPSSSQRGGGGGARVKGRSASGPPIVPDRTSSLSAPTTKKNWRASLTSESLLQHTMAMDIEQHKHVGMKPDLRVYDDEQEQGQRDIQQQQEPPFRVADNDYLLRPQSIPITAASSTPGTVELEEATAVNVFPHKNTSLQIVEHKVLPGSRTDLALRALREQREDSRDSVVDTYEDAPETGMDSDNNIDTYEDAPEMAATTPTRRDSHVIDTYDDTPDISTEASPRSTVHNEDMNWPLTNPRVAPIPPSSMPPSSSPPAYEGEGLDEQRWEHAGTDRRGSDLIQGSSTTTTQRRKSSFGSAALQSLSLLSVKNRQKEKKRDKRLPQPRGILGQSSPSDLNNNSSSSTFMSMPPPPPPEYGESIVDNRSTTEQQQQQQHMFLDGSLVAARRSPEMRRLLDGMSMQSSQRRNVVAARRELIRASNTLHPRRLQSMPRQVVIRARSIPVRAMRKQIRRQLQQRADIKREHWRDRMKRSIVITDHEFAFY